MIPNLKQRNLRGELMDDPNLDPHKHRQALNGLRRINRVTNAYHPVWREIRRCAHPERPLSLLDVGCGGGDTLSAIGNYAREANINIDLYGLDISPVAIESATARLAASNLQANYYQHNILEQPLPQKFDVVLCSLFLHHFNNDYAAQLLARMKSHTNQLLLISDLLRSTVGYLYAVIGTRLLSRSRIVHVDGPRSVEAAFTLKELGELLKNCELTDATIRRFWPERFVLKWSP